MQTQREIPFPFSDYSATCEQCGKSLTPDQHAGGFCSPECRRAFLADAEAALQAMLAVEVQP